MLSSNKLLPMIIKTVFIKWWCSAIVNLWSVEWGYIIQPPLVKKSFLAYCSRRWFSVVIFLRVRPMGTISGWKEWRERRQMELFIWPLCAGRTCRLSHRGQVDPQGGLCREAVTRIIRIYPCFTTSWIGNVVEAFVDGIKWIHRRLNVMIALYYSRST